MHEILVFLQGALWLAFLLPVLIALAIFFKFRYKVPRADQALVITGGRGGLRVLPGKGAFVSPLRKHQYFPIGVMTARSDSQETQTITLVPVVVEWTAQLRADVETDGALVKAVQGFSGYKTDDEIKESLTQTLDGEVRAVVATMTPEEVVQDKSGFSTKVEDGVKARMEDLGFQLVSLNIATVTDRNGHYHNLATEDRETRRKTAETFTAQANKEIAVQQAQADQAAQTAQLDRDLQVSEKQREVTLRQAAIQAETDAARADAEIAGQLQLELRNQELAAREGEVAVVKEQQRQAAATARREVEVTEAETAKQKAEIEAAAHARTEEIAAQAEAAVAKAKANGEAEAAKAKATGEADAITLQATAEAARIRETGQAAAEVARAQGEAEAAAILARGEAEAEVQRRMAEALAANEGANLKVTLAEINRDTTVRVMTTVGEAMARIGEHATFIDMGGSSNGEGGDLLTRVLGNVPELIKQLDVKNQALNGGSFGDTLGALVASVTGAAATPSDGVVVEVPAVVAARAAAESAAVGEVEATPVVPDASPVVPALDLGEGEPDVPALEPESAPESLPAPHGKGDGKEAGRRSSRS